MTVTLFHEHFSYFNHNFLRNAEAVKLPSSLLIISVISFYTHLHKEDVMYYLTYTVLG